MEDLIFSINKGAFNNMAVNQAKVYKTISVDDFLGGNSASSFSFNAISRLLKIYRWPLLISMLIGALVGMHVSTKQVPIYRSSLSMLVQPQFANSAQVGQGYLEERSYRYYETQYRIIRSRAVLSRVVDKLSLLSEETNYSYAVSSNVLLILLKKIGSIVKDTSSLEGERIKSLSFNSRDQAVQYISANLSLVSSDQTELLELKFSSPSSRFSADALNAIASSYQDYLEESKTSRVDQASSWLTEQLAEIKKELKQAEIELQEYRANFGTFDADNLTTSTEKSLSELQASKNEANLRYKSLVQRYGPKHPKLLAAQAELRIAENELSRGSSKAVKDRGKEFDLVRLEGNVDSARNLYTMFLQRFQEANKSTDVRLSDATIVDFARAPKRPHNITGVKTVLLSSLVGLFLCAGFIVLRFNIDSTFKSHSQVEKRLGLSVLSVLPRISKQLMKSGSIAPFYRSKDCAIYTENINRVRSSLQYADEGKPMNVVQMTSSVEGEGKSTLSFNLALAFAHMGKKTLIIDADMRRPQLHRVIKDFKGKYGLSDWLNGDCSLAESISKCKYNQALHVIHSGSRTDSPLELLSSGALDKVISTLKDHYDHVIIDSPPVLPVADSIMIGRKVDGVILVVEAQRTETKVAQEALDQMQEAGIVPIGTVLSKLSDTAAEYYYPRKNYGYGYGQHS